MSGQFGPRRAVWITAPDPSRSRFDEADLAAMDVLDRVYRSLCAMLYNYVPMSGHPGGSISSGRIVQTLLFRTMDYDPSNPDRHDADMISYAAGHKALGLYAIWALRNEVLRIGARELLPVDLRHQLRLEDLLGFRRNPITPTSLFKQFGVKPLDGHPTPATPFLRLATGASGVGVGSSFGLALGAADMYRDDPPRVHVIEGEGGLTPGRVAEALAFAGTASLRNVILHLDWNQASIDSDHVTRDGETPGDYVQWNPMELFYLHDWNVIEVADGTDFTAISAAQQTALDLDNGQPTAIVYRTTKGWKYGIEGKGSHGAGHKLCSAGYYEALDSIIAECGIHVPTCDEQPTRCAAGTEADTVEKCFWEALCIVRVVLVGHETATPALAEHLREAKARLDRRTRTVREGFPRVEHAFELAHVPEPRELELTPGTVTTLRGQLGKVFAWLNRETGGALLVSAADLLGSTSVNEASKGFAPGFLNFSTNPDSRTVATGGICEDGMTAILSGLSAFGDHIGVGSSYGAFIAPLGHIAARLHAIGGQARRAIADDPYHPFFLVCAHAGLKTGEDGPTHADPQPLQLLQENFPAGTMVTLTPWDPAEVAPLVLAALRKRPAVIAPFVTRPSERVPDRVALRLAPAAEAAKGVYHLRKARGESRGTVVLQESGITMAFIRDALPLLDRAGVDIDVFYVASAELFDGLPASERGAIFPEKNAQEAMGITGFTMATMYRWIRSDLGRRHSMHPFQKGHFLGSGPGDVVIAEAGLDGESQYHAILKYVEELEGQRRQSRAAEVVA